MSENKLPEGVGKKIVEALKKQTEIEDVSSQIKIEDDESVLTAEEMAFEKLISEDVEESFTQQAQVVSDESLEDDLLSELNSFEPDESKFSQSEQSPAFEQEIQPQVQYTQPQQPQYQQSLDYSAPQYQQPNPQPEPAQDYNVPANVAVLRRLINQLPQGVTKHTGAQIIRQTMEALGISMSTVLAEAQQFQDDLNVSVKHCASSIQEYKASIKNLEKQVNDYQRQSMQVNDLISLFIMTDK